MHETPRPAQRLAIIDLGSNSGRVVVLHATEDAELGVVDEHRVPLQLARELREGELTAAGVDRTVTAVGDFVAIARGAGVQEVVVVGTSALRDASNASGLAHELSSRYGVELEVVSGEEEAEYGFWGSVYGVDVSSGIMIDIGGGSLELVHFDDRRPQQSWSFPLGSLRLQDRFLNDDPPTADQIQKLMDYVTGTLAGARVPRLQAGQRLVGTGGTIRNLAKMDVRRRSYPIRRLHGYELPARQIAALATSLATQTAEERRGVPGLSSSRADSIVSGALAVHAVTRWTRAPGLTVSGQGLREGVARRRFEAAMPAPVEVRERALRSLAARFASHEEAQSQVRRALMRELLDLVLPGAPQEIRDAGEAAAYLLDIGASIDFYNRHDHTAEIVLRSGMQGFPHRTLATTAALVRLAEDPGAANKQLRPLLDREAVDVRASASALLALADEVTRRVPPSAPSPQVRLDDGVLTVAAAVPAWWVPAELTVRIEETCGVRLILQGDAS